MHGNSNKKETAPDGSKDENVFDIMQGVSINICIKSRNKNRSLAEVYHCDVYGKRQIKYDQLSSNTLVSLPFEKLQYRAPEYFFVQKDFQVAKAYEKGFSVNKLFPTNSSGIKTHRDHFVIDIDKCVLQKRIETFFNSQFTDDEIRAKFNLKDNRDWSLSEARSKNDYQQENSTEIMYRPFDTRNIYYDENTIDFDRLNVMQHFIKGKAENFGLAFNRQIEVHRGFSDVFIFNNLFQLHSLSLKESNNCAPLYLYPEADKQQSLDENTERKPNLDPEAVATIATGLKLTFETEKSGDNDKFAPIDLLDYIYAVLHSPTYRETYKEFLKIDFPRIPYPADTQKFWTLVKLGGELRQIHLLESPVVENPITSYPVDGDNVVARKITKTSPGYEATAATLGKVHINDEQYFADVPLLAWEFYIGGYQPAQKWLKDRVGRKLSFDDILHYQKIIIALNETARIMQEIDTTAAD